jgi:hypothetical protein
MRVTDREVERLGARLGEDVGARLDVEGVASQVTARLRVSGGAVPVRPVGRWLAMAAGLALMVSAGWFTFGRDGLPPLAGAGPVLTPGLHDLSATELRQVLDSLSPPQPSGVVGRGTLDDLDAEQLETLLTMMEG